MRRGLKRSCGLVHNRLVHVGERSRPDEKGIETVDCLHERQPQSQVSAHAPMRRGLKLNLEHLVEQVFRSVSAHAPMRRGLKRISKHPGISRHYGERSRPDEKGIETYHGYPSQQCANSK